MTSAAIVMTVAVALAASLWALHRAWKAVEERRQLVEHDEDRFRTATVQLFITTIQPQGDE